MDNKENSKETESMEIISVSQESTFPTTFEEFKDKISQFTETKGTLENVSDIYSKVPIWIKLLTNFDPTGVSGAIDQILTDNRAKREQESILLAIYGLGRSIYEIQSQLNEESLLVDQIPTHTYMYFEKCKSEKQSSKVEYFRKVWKHAIVDNSNTVEEKSYIFDIVETLTEEQMTIFKIIFDNQQSSESQKKATGITELSERLGISKMHAQQACINMQGKGLIYDAGIGKYGYNGPNNFCATDYVDTIIKYIE